MVGGIIFLVNYFLDEFFVWDANKNINNMIIFILPILIGVIGILTCWYFRTSTRSNGIDEKQVARV